MPRAALSLTIAAVLGWGLAVGVVLAKPEPDDEDARAEPDSEMTDGQIDGLVMDAWWADHTPALLVFDDNTHIKTTVYAETPEAREAILSGYACVGRHVSAMGERIDDETLKAQGIRVNNAQVPCERTI